MNSGVESVAGTVVASGAEREAEVEHPLVLCARVSVGLFRLIDGRLATCSRDPGAPRWYGHADRHTVPRRAGPGRRLPLLNVLGGLPGPRNGRWGDKSAVTF